MQSDAAKAAPLIWALCFSDMKSLAELIEKDEPAIELINSWAQEANNNVTILPPSSSREEILCKTQISTRSALGALAYETGGVLIHHGLLRFPGSGHPTFDRVLPDWNENLAQEGLYFVCDDVVGGFFAINGGAFAGDIGKVYYWPPDSFEWEPIDLQFSEFLHWALIGDLGKFYDGLIWEDWEKEVQEVGSNMCINFYPPLWAKEGGPEISMKAPVPIGEAFELKIDVLKQFNDKT